MDDDEVLVSRLQRELGLVAARAEQGRVKAEEALKVELQKNAELSRSAQDSADQVAALQLEAEGLRRELAAAQEAASRAGALGEEVVSLRRDLSHAKEAAAAAAARPAAPESPELFALRDEVERLRRELSEAHAAAEDARASEAVAVAASAPGEAEVAKLRKELRGMSVVVSTLEKKLSTYEHRLMEQASTCAEEINDLKCRLSSLLGSNSTSPRSGMSMEAEFEDDLSDLRLRDDSVPPLGLGGLGLGGVRPSPGMLPWTSGDDYMRLGHDGEDNGDSNARGGGSSLLAGMAKHWSVPSGVGFFGNNLPSGLGFNTSVGFNGTGAEPQSPGGYQPPKLPDAI